MTCGVQPIETASASGPADLVRLASGTGIYLNPIPVLAVYPCPVHTEISDQLWVLLQRCALARSSKGVERVAA